MTGQGGYQSAVLRTLLEPQSAFYTIAAGLTQPIFDGGQLQGNLDLQKGRQDELLQNYRKAVISASPTSRTRSTPSGRRTAARALQSEVVDSSRRAFDISEQRLREGTVDLITVLQTQQTSVPGAGRAGAGAAARLQAIVSLYQALGGGWLPKPPVDRRGRADAR